MAKDPAFLFYPNDYLGGTMGMTFEEKGAYIELLMTQFNRGHMSGHMVGQIVGQIWDKIKDKFIQDENGLWFNERLEHEQNARKSYVSSRKNNLKGINQYTNKEGHINGHMSNHMEDVNKDVLKDIKEPVKILIPDLATFVNYGIEISNNNYRMALEGKYEQWKTNGWKDGNNKPVKDWKAKLKNTIPFLKPFVNEFAGRKELK